MKIKLTLLIGLALAQISPIAMADQSDSFGSYTIHFNTFTTFLLDPAIASKYGITRHKSQALVMVSILRKVMGTTGQPAKATVSITATTTSGEQTKLDIRELNDAGAIYYLGEMAVPHQEDLTITVAWTPEGETSPYGKSTPYHVSTFHDKHFTK